MERVVVNTREELLAIVKSAAIDADLNYLDVSSVTDMTDMFKHSQFNGDISKWMKKPGNYQD